MADDPRLSEGARRALANRDRVLFWSAASTWELAIKSSVGKLRLPEPLGAYLDTRLSQQGIHVLPIAQSHAAAVESLPHHHRDPFDRMLVAQAQVDGLSLVSGDPRLADYGVNLIW